MTTDTTFDEPHADQVGIGVCLDFGHDRGPRRVGRWCWPYGPTHITDLGHEQTSVWGAVTCGPNGNSSHPRSDHRGRLTSDDPSHPPCSGRPYSFWVRLHGDRCHGKTDHFVVGLLGHCYDTVDGDGWVRRYSTGWNGQLDYKKGPPRERLRVLTRVMSLMVINSKYNQSSSRWTFVKKKKSLYVRNFTIVSRIIRDCKDKSSHITHFRLSHYVCWVVPILRKSKYWYSN